MEASAAAKYSSSALVVGLALVLSLACLGTPLQAFTKQTGDRGEILVGELTQLTKKYDIQRVPTIIFLKGGKELGRIIEYPKDTMEADFLAIIGVK